MRSVSTSISGARLAGAREIVAVDPDERRLELAGARGATLALAPGDAFDPVDYAFEAVGDPEVMAQALDALAPGGELVLVGATARDALLSFHPRAFLSRQQRIVGCIYGSLRPHEHLPILLGWCAEGRVPVATSWAAAFGWTSWRTRSPTPPAPACGRS